MNPIHVTAGLGSGIGLAWLYNSLIGHPFGLALMPDGVGAVFVAAVVAVAGWTSGRIDARAKRVPAPTPPPATFTATERRP